MTNELVRDASYALRVAALVLFILAAIPVPARKVNLAAAGLACWVLSSIL